jgi:hypothetical protein
MKTKHTIEEHVPKNNQENDRFGPCGLCTGVIGYTNETKQQEGTVLNQQCSKAVVAQVTGDFV